MLEELYPDGMQETELAERVISLSWRLGRTGRYQNAVFEALYDQHAAASGQPDTGESVPSDPVLGRMLLADFSGDRVLERVLLYERRIESSLCRARAELRQLRRQPRKAAQRGATFFDKTWEDSAGYGHGSPFAGADSILEASDPALSAEDRLCETKPIRPDIGLVPGGEAAEPVSACMRLRRSARDDLVERERPTYENAPAADGMACQTKPIAVGSQGGQLLNGADVMSDSVPDRLGENKANSPEQRACEAVVRWAGGPTPPGLRRLDTG